MSETCEHGFRVDYACQGHRKRAKRTQAMSFCHHRSPVEKLLCIADSGHNGEHRNCGYRWNETIEWHEPAIIGGCKVCGGYLFKGVDHRCPGPTMENQT